MARNEHDGRSLEERLASLDAMSSQGVDPAPSGGPGPGNASPAESPPAAAPAADDATDDATDRTNASPSASPASSAPSAAEAEATVADAEATRPGGDQNPSGNEPTAGQPLPEAPANPWAAPPPFQGAPPEPPQGGPSQPPADVPQPPSFTPYGDMPAPQYTPPPPFDGSQPPPQPYDGSPMPQPFDGGMLPPPYAGMVGGYPPVYEPPQPPPPPPGFEGAMPPPPPPYEAPAVPPQPASEGGQPGSDTPPPFQAPVPPQYHAAPTPADQAAPPLEQLPPYPTEQPSQGDPQSASAGEAAPAEPDTQPGRPVQPGQQDAPPQEGQQGQPGGAPQEGQPGQPGQPGVPPYGMPAMPVPAYDPNSNPVPGFDQPPAYQPPAGYAPTAPAQPPAGGYAQPPAHPGAPGHGGQPHPQAPQGPPPESSESLSSENLLGHRRIAPSGGWRRAVYKATGGAIHPGESQAELRRKDLIARARTPVVSGHHRVAVMSLKGGVGKTTTTVGLGSMLASLRGDRVIAVDANPDRGTLSDKLRLETAATVRDLLNNRDKIHRYADVRAFTSQNEARLEVLASDRDPAVSEAFSAEDYSAVAVVLEQFYTICITDCGTGLLHSAMAGVLSLADQLVLVSSPSVDGARSASATLDWLEAHDHGHLVRNGVVVLSMVRNRTRSQVDLDKLQAHFESRCRGVVRVPYDDHLEEGAEVDLEQLAPATREAYLQLAAMVGDGFAMQRAKE
ncbi:hypothetical protein Arub01_29950 [Actinomadura rubrobrunea]|uniref:CobQ/CobB/MinD/ParA nucleotide binding domain-containing protein n=1 Tax=Actinomadura rubrobrunea TaxID=115335 RepID=A0A9W6PX17_9ACTN|nr:MinD/ParA family protein [Actinomadura rubrobrunea]GLW64751.1 hypothetical protein Arub01_29950 [Actinomadura rubrobrunea]